MNTKLDKEFENIGFILDKSQFETYNDFVDKTKLISKCCFVRLFIECTNLIDASNLILPATTLTESCYEQMFTNCNELTLVPKLPATNLDTNCYNDIFMYSLKITELHYPSSIENDPTFTSMSGSPKFGATNATVYYDL